MRSSPLHEFFVMEEQAVELEEGEIVSDVDEDPPTEQANDNEMVEEEEQGDEVEVRTLIVPHKMFYIGCFFQHSKRSTKTPNTEKGV